MSERTEVVCGQCDSVVGLPSDRLKDDPRCPKCHSPLFEGKPIELTATNFDKHISRGGLPLVVDFWAPCAIPTMIVFRAGREIARHSGAMDSATMSRWLGSLL